MANKDLKTCVHCKWKYAYCGQYYYHCKNCGRKNIVKKMPRGEK